MDCAKGAGLKSVFLAKSGMAFKALFRVSCGNHIGIKTILLVHVGQHHTFSRYMFFIFIIKRKSVVAVQHEIGVLCQFQYQFIQTVISETNQHSHQTVRRVEKKKNFFSIINRRTARPR